MKMHAQSCVAGALRCMSSAAHAQITDGVIKIGVMNDMSGTYADLAGRARWSPRAWRSRISAPPRRA